MTGGQLNQVAALVATPSEWVGHPTEAAAVTAIRVLAPAGNTAAALPAVKALLATVSGLSALGVSLRAVFGLSTNQTASGI